MTMKDEYWEDCLLRYANGETDEAETARVEAWLAESDERRALLRRIQLLSLAADLQANPATENMFIVSPLTGDTMRRMFSTHPPMEERIANLQEMARTGRYPG